MLIMLSGVESNIAKISYETTEQMEHSRIIISLLLECGSLPPSNIHLYPPDVIHMVSVTKPSPFIVTLCRILATENHRRVPSFLHGCEIKSGSGLGMRLASIATMRCAFLIFFFFLPRITILKAKWYTCLSSCDGIW